MNRVNVAFNIPSEIQEGLINGTYERIGGVICDSKTKKIVVWLREIQSVGEIGSFVGSLNLGISVINLGVSCLNLGVSVMGFTAVLKQLEQIEKSLQQMQEVLLKSNQQLASKIDLSFYANFRAALQLADYAFTMSDIENRKACAAQAINRFLEAEAHYSDYAKSSIDIGSRTAEQYLSTLFLAYIVEAQCHLELGEAATATLCLKKGSHILRSLTEAYLKNLLTSNPAAYLHPALNETINLSRLTRIYQWLNPLENENSVFQAQRLNMYRIAQSPDSWIKSLCDGVLEHIKERGIPQIYSYLPLVMEKMEAMLETYRRFESYQSEVKAIAQLGMTFQEWRQLQPLEEQPENAELIYLIPAEPV